ncbi:right-handed parallel beta-helix repeat-containing protein [candidate division KSB1 bacterium]|nr:right-handed parallel beta-helix repeat-containing protein [candidate division KSB1 bacterium]
MIKPVTFLIFLTFLFLLGCHGKNGTGPQDKSDPVPNDNPYGNVIGLIDDYKLEDPPSYTVYIDPENDTSSQTKGTKDNPHKSLDGVRWVPGLTIAFKRGTTFKTNRQIVIECDNITLMSYGESTERPVVQSTEETHAVVGHWQGVKNAVIRDLEIFSMNGTASITFNPADDGNSNISVINCKLHGGGWGLRSMGTDGLLVENTEVFDTKDDGIFIRWDDNIEICFCYVHDVNKNWKPPHTPESDAGGDAVQLADSRHWHVHHNVLDRSSSGNKFAFISNNPDQREGILEFNKLVGPRVDGSSIYIGDGSGLIIRYNIITDCPGNPLYSHASELKIYGNVITRLGGPIFISASGYIFRNTFHDVGRIAQGGRLFIESNIFSFTSSGQKDYNHIDVLIESNNLYAGAASAASKSFTGNPDFVSIDEDNFRLGEESDAIDRGTDTEMEYDFDGTKIPQGNGPDVGAFEKNGP